VLAGWYERWGLQVKGAWEPGDGDDIGSWLKRPVRPLTRSRRLRRAGVLIDNLEALAREDVELWILQWSDKIL